MHELLLQSLVPQTRHAQVLNILAGLAAMQPQPVLEEYHVFKPNRPPGMMGGQRGAVQDVDVGKSQAQMQQALASGDLYYLKVVREIETRTEGKDGEKGVEGNKNGEDGDAMKIDGVEKSKDTDNTSSQGMFTLQFRDLPEPTRQKDRAVTVRMIADTPISSGDPWSFMKALDYSHVSKYFVEGERLTQNSTSLLLYRVLVPIANSQNPGQPGRGPFRRNEIRLLDPSGNYIFQATVRVQDGSKVEIMTKGVNELMSLKETLKGVLELEMAERLALDTRVR